MTVFMFTRFRHMSQSFMSHVKAVISQYISMSFNRALFLF